MSARTLSMYDEGLLSMRRVLISIKISIISSFDTIHNVITDIKTTLNSNKNRLGYANLE